MRRLITETIEDENIPQDKVLIHAMKEHIERLKEGRSLKATPL